MSAGLKLVDMTEDSRKGREVVKKSARTAVSWFVTIVWNKSVRRVDEDGEVVYMDGYAEYKDYISRRLGYFFDSGIWKGSLVKKSTINPDLVDFNYEGSLEINEAHDYLHAHLQVNAEFPREISPTDEKGRLKRPLIDSGDFGRLLRETVDLGWNGSEWEIKTMVKIMGSNASAANVRLYFLKHAKKD